MKISFRHRVFYCAWITETKDLVSDTDRRAFFSFYVCRLYLIKSIEPLLYRLTVKQEIRVEKYTLGQFVGQL